MKLSYIQKNWEKWAHEDPFWAICTDATARGHKWNIEQFFASGYQEIEQVVHRIDRMGIRLDRSSVLDFGCGVGRLTQALALYFERCYGVDIAPRMIELAQQYNAHSEKCQYMLNEVDHLGLFTDSMFDFIYCSRVLQHMEPKYSVVYIREFIRTLKPGGLLVFQLPSGQHGFKKFLKTLLPIFIVNFLRRAVYRSTAVMEMYTVAQEIVARTVEESGGRLVSVIYTQRAGPDYVSPEYYITK